MSAQNKSSDSATTITVKQLERLLQQSGWIHETEIEKNSPEIVDADRDGIDEAWDLSMVDFEATPEVTVFSGQATITSELGDVQIICQEYWYYICGYSEEACGVFDESDTIENPEIRGAVLVDDDGTELGPADLKEVLDDYYGWLEPDYSCITEDRLIKKVSISEDAPEA